MLKNLKDLFDTLTAGLTAPGHAQTAAEQAHTLQLSTAVLLVEVMRADPTLNDSERDAVLTALRRKFALSDDELQRLLDMAHETSRTAYDFHRFTDLMNERFTQAQKIAVVEAMWEVALADHHLDANEHHVISKVAGLLHVTHGEYIAAKLHVQAALKR
ncbi:tellurite resistance TerB family protein [Hydrogenophaga sp. BPS33]|uniref:tellurite resistance TerB family protein n=1 Tax=Hydrogenophaga sp. BPS33 TaxID=2651974 RepID=UPI00131F9C39|nr:TerB family tellurite resistance protein [Hydrogenophaga sp. BPS33]QHE85357.1 TerB family tellurite resistance protein [Hydrogenophaga sp. BPS33]